MYLVWFHCQCAAVTRAAVPGKFTDEDIDLDDLENLEEMMEGLQFDIDGFLDLDQFDFDEVAPFSPFFFSSFFFSFLLQANIISSDFLQIQNLVKRYEVKTTVCSQP